MSFASGAGGDDCHFLAVVGRMTLDGVGDVVPEAVSGAGSVVDRIDLLRTPGDVLLVHLLSREEEDDPDDDRDCGDEGDVDDLLLLGVHVWFPFVFGVSV